MKVILNTDVKHLGEEGDVKEVANGYARNFLFPRNLALPYNDVTHEYFESRRAEIEAKKEVKRNDSRSLRDRLVNHLVEIPMPAGANGKLYGAVTSQTISDALKKAGFEIERKRIEVPGLTIKNLGKTTVIVKLYEALTAEVEVLVVNQDDVKDAKEQKKTEETAEVKAEEKSQAVEETPAEVEEQNTENTEA
ncbi:MAG TPA: 50S ribosomal protein L9 [Treponemataceae bacterium]|jgi:large subunit ribosomal protein L9|nr:50S ribosomal protein L9 [Treponemataceae bacterium]HOQ92055.1 50S ribosomal protein L9 [Treponemataceae bacterium]HPM05469.1 50S ribosomal protein L9 [Treponemataceae bacterium]HUH44086.1 50S ribosomal protein L9 [Treponemataceae bacterium]